MFLRVNKVVVFVLMSLSLTACGGGGDFTSSSGIPEFNGTWVSDCFTNGVTNDSLINTTTISGTSATFTIMEYSSVDCMGTASGTTELIADMVFGADRPEASSVCTNVKEVDFNVLSINENGISSTESEILGFLGLPTLTVYDLICSEGNQLFTGEFTQDLDGSTAAKRPEFIDHGSPLTK
jgi:hypothetical protein